MSKVYKVVMSKVYKVVMSKVCMFNTTKTPWICFHQCDEQAIIDILCCDDAIYGIWSGDYRN